MTDEARLNDDDRALSALLDDALPPEEAEALRRRLEREPALANRLERLANVDATLQAAYGGVAEEPLPKGVTDLLAARAEAERFRPTPAPVRGGSPFRSTVVAALALAAGFALAMLILPRGAGGDPLGILGEGGTLGADSPLHAALQQAASGTSHALPGGADATPRLSFLDAAGRPCRRVDVRAAQGSAATVACRGEGGWRLEFVAFSGTAGGGPDGVFRPAGDPSSPAVDRAIDALIAGQPLDRAAEREWIDRDWRTGP